MKPEHFIYKSNDLYYMQNVPDRPVLSCGVEATESNCPLEYCRCYKKTIAYNEALERAKAEAGKCDIKLEVKAVASAMVQGVITSDKDWIEGQIYTINMEEKIEVIEEPEFPGFDHTSYPTFRNIARIAAPKKEEESEEHLWNLVLSTYGGKFYNAGKSGEERIISDITKEFEIKRKAL